MREQVGNKFDWKVVSAGVDFERGNPLSNIMGALFAPIPIVWIRIAV